MSIFKAVEKHESLICRIKETIAPLQRKKLWNDETFFKSVEDFLTAGDLCEEQMCKIVADALFNLKMSQPEVEDVQKLVHAFPGALKCKNKYDYLPIEQLTKYPEPADQGKKGAHYITALSLEGLKHNVGGENMRGGLLCVSGEKNTLQILSKYCSDDRYFEPLKDLRNHKLLLKQDIVDFKLLYYSCIGEHSSKRFQYLIEWDHEALLKTTVNGVPLIHAAIKHKQKKNTNEQSNVASFTRFLKFSLPHYKHLLFLKDDNDQTAIEQAIMKFGEKKTMTILRDFFTKDASYPILHQVIVHEPKYYNLFLRWFPYIFHLRDENGRTTMQVMLSMNREFLYNNPTFWINQTTDQLEEKDPKTRLRPFASVAYGMLGDLDLSYQILRKHPSVIDVILEQRENTVDVNNDRKRNAEEEDLDNDNKKKKSEEVGKATA